MMLNVLGLGNPDRKADRRQEWVRQEDRREQSEWFQTVLLKWLSVK